MCLRVCLRDTLSQPRQGLSWAWGQVPSRLPQAFSESPELIPAPTQPRWPRPGPAQPLEDAGTGCPSGSRPVAAQVRHTGPGPGAPTSRRNGLAGAPGSPRMELRPKTRLPLQGLGRHGVGRVCTDDCSLSKHRHLPGPGPREGMSQHGRLPSGVQSCGVRQADPQVTEAWQDSFPVSIAPCGHPGPGGPGLLARTATEEGLQPRAR